MILSDYQRSITAVVIKLIVMSNIFRVSNGANESDGSQSGRATGLQGDE